MRENGEDSLDWKWENKENARGENMEILMKMILWKHAIHYIIQHLKSHQMKLQFLLS